MSVLQQDRARRAVATFDRYADAQRAVDYLSDRKFCVERLSIVGQDLRLVEEVTGRHGYGEAAVQGLLSGAIVGAFVGFLLGAFSLFDPLTSALALGMYGLLVGAVAGLVFGLLGHGLTGGRRDFRSVSAVQAGRYELLADDDVAERAIVLLSQAPPR